MSEDLTIEDLKQDLEKIQDQVDKFNMKYKDYTLLDDFNEYDQYYAPRIPDTSDYMYTYDGEDFGPIIPKENMDGYKLVKKKDE